MEKHLYSSGNVLSFRFRLHLNDGDKDVAIKFVNGQYKTDDDEIAKVLDKQLQTNSSISRFVKKIDIAAAEKMARDHQARLNRTGAVRGQLTTDMVRQAQNTEVAQRDAELLEKAVKNVQEVAEEEHNLTMTVAGDKPAPIIGAPESVLINKETQPVVVEKKKPIALSLQLGATKSA